MKRLALALVFTVFGHWAMAQNVTQGTLTITQPWAHSTPTVKQDGAAYLTIVNRGAVSDRLLSLSTPVARQAEIHRSSVDNGVMRMRAVQGGISLAPGATVRFAPGGLHIMLLGMQKPLRVGEHFTLRLRFAKAGVVTVRAEVRDMPGANDGMQMDMKM